MVNYMNLRSLTSEKARHEGEFRTRAVIHSLAGRNLRGPPVDDAGDAVGIVTTLDPCSPWPDREKQGFLPKAEHPRVARVMNRDVFRVNQDTSLPKTMRLMVEQGLKWLPVVDGEGHYLGMIRRDALLIALSHDL